MYKLYSFIFIFFTSSVVLAKDTNSSAAELEQYNDRFNEIATTYDLAAFMKLYSDDALWIAPGERPVPVAEAGKAQFQFLVNNKGVLSHTVDNTFMSQDGTQAVMIGTSSVEVESLGFGGTATYLFVMERAKHGDAWKIKADMFNQHAPEPAAAKPDSE